MSRRSIRILLIGLGVSSIGDFIYLVALHVYVLVLRKHALFTWVYSLATGVMIMGMAADSQEVVLATNALHLGEFGYSMMVFAAGVGFVAGSSLLSVIARRVPTVWMLGVGRPISALGYLIYALAPGFGWAVAGLVILGFFGSVAGVGLTTYMQKSIPVTQMGRLNNLLVPAQQVSSIVMILLAGWLVGKCLRRT